MTLSKRNALLVILALLVVAVAIGAVLRYLTQRPLMPSSAYPYEARYTEADRLHHEAGKLDESIAAFEALAKEAPTRATAAQAKMILAFDLFSRNRGDDRPRAVSIYKELVIDPALSGLQRAIAANELLDLYNGTHDERFAETVIFTGDPFASFLQKNDIEASVRRFYEYVDEIYPLSLTEFRVARLYGNELEQARAETREAEQLFAQLVAWTAKGEANLPASLKLRYEPSKLGYIYQMQGLSRRSVAQFSNKNYAPAEAAFKSALRALAPENELHTYGMGLYVRFHYAGMLADAYGQGRLADITAILKPVTSPPAPAFQNHPFPFFEFLKNEMAEAHDTHGHKQDIIRLSKLVPEFKAMLDRHGLAF